MIKLILLILVILTQLTYAKPVKPKIKNTKPINYQYKNTIHPISKVKYNRNGFPVFKNNMSCRLPMHLHNSSDNKQFRFCNQKLLRQLQKNTTLSKNFSKKQLEAIRHNKIPDGYTWHHNQKKGLLELVDREIHNKTAHTGGRKIWGGGNDNR